MRRGLDLAAALDAKIILMEGYDVFYEEHDEGTVARFVEGLRQCAAWAAPAAIMLGLENVDVPVTGTMGGLLQLIDAVNSPWLQVYADMANLVAMAPAPPPSDDPRTPLPSWASSRHAAASSPSTSRTASPASCAASASARGRSPLPPPSRL